MRRLVALLLAFAGIATFGAPVRAFWIENGVPVATPPSPANVGGTISDGSGGVITAWQDSRNGFYDIYAQRVDANGAPLWAINGVAVCTAAGDQEAPRLVGDGAGGAILVWDDYRADQAIYAQRVDANGVPQWTANGVAICTVSGIQFLQQIATDGAGGAVMTWTDGRSGTSYDIYAQRVNASGVPQWAANGVAVSVGTGHQLKSQIIADGGGGAFLAWDDARSGNTHIYAQHLNPSGAAQWAANGISVSGVLGAQNDAAPALDDAGGVLIAFQDDRQGTRDIFINRVNASGTTLWGFDGTGQAVCQAVDVQEYPALVSDGAGGAIVAWDDYRDGAQLDVYAQRVNAGGAPMWTFDGVPICNASGDQQNPRIVADGSGGAVIFWNDHRVGAWTDIYARAVSANGTTAWQYDGMPVSTASIAQDEPYPVLDGTGGVIVVFNDNHSAYPNVYAQRVELRYGYWGRPEPSLTNASDNPGDQGGAVILRWRASERDRFYDPSITHYSVWRATDNIAQQSAEDAGAPLRVTSPAEIGADFEGSAWWEEATASGPSYWEWVANQGAQYQDTYSILAPTRQDEVIGIPAPHYFKVIAHESEYVPSRTWESGVVTASSLDNLAPAAPIQLTGDRAASGVFLSWTGGDPAPDFLTYRIYRSTTGEVTPSPGFLLISSDTPSYVDANAPSGSLHYLVTALDVHRNESAPSNVVGVFDATGVGDDTPALTTLQVRQNQPNPFNGGTAFRVGLPAAADVAVDVYDVAGRRVRTLRAAGIAAGWHVLPFDGRDDSNHPLPSGVYFYRVSAGGRAATSRMVITR